LGGGSAGGFAIIRLLQAMARSSRELNHRGSSLHELLHRVRDASGRQLDVRFGPKADMRVWNRDARFTPESGHVRPQAQCPLCAKRTHAPQQKKPGHSITFRSRYRLLSGM